MVVLFSSTRSSFLWPAQIVPPPGTRFKTVPPPAPFAVHTFPPFLSPPTRVTEDSHPETVDLSRSFRWAVFCTHWPRFEGLLSCQSIMHSRNPQVLQPEALCSQSIIFSRSSGLFCLNRAWMVSPPQDRVGFWPGSLGEVPRFGVGTS